HMHVAIEGSSSMMTVHCSADVFPRAPFFPVPQSPNRKSLACHHCLTHMSHNALSNGLTSLARSVIISSRVLAHTSIPLTSLSLHIRSLWSEGGYPLFRGPRAKVPAQIERPIGDPLAGRVTHSISNIDCVRCSARPLLLTHMLARLQFDESAILGHAH